MDKTELLDQIDDAIRAHSAVSRALTLAISNHDVSKSSHDIGRVDKCAFGRWLNNPMLTDDVRGSKPYKVIARLHEEFHSTAGKVAALNEQGRQIDAFDLLDGEYTQRTDTLLRALNKWRGENAH